jgi:gas vesicle protein
MKKIKNHKKRSAGKVFTGLLIGGVVGATVGWLTAPASGEEMRRRLKGDLNSARERAKTAEGNIESQARELVDQVREQAGYEGSVAHSRKTVSPVG